MPPEQVKLASVEGGRLPSVEWGTLAHPTHSPNRRGVGPARTGGAHDVRMVIDWPVIDDLDSTPLRRDAQGQRPTLIVAPPWARSGLDQSGAPGAPRLVWSGGQGVLLRSPSRP